MALNQLPRVPHNTRTGPSTGQPFRWAVVVNELAFLDADFFRDGILLGWQGWSPIGPDGPYWRYWTGDLLGRRVWVSQVKEYPYTYKWRIGWYEPGDEEFMMLVKEQTPSYNRQPWDDIPFNYPWLPIIPGSDYLVLPGNTWCYWYKTAQAALADFPLALRQDDYDETFGRSLWASP